MKTCIISVRRVSSFGWHPPGQPQAFLTLKSLILKRYHHVIEMTSMNRITRLISFQYHVVNSLASKTSINRLKLIRYHTRGGKCFSFGIPKWLARSSKKSSTSSALDTKRNQQSSYYITKSNPYLINLGIASSKTSINRLKLIRYQVGQAGLSNRRIRGMIRFMYPYRGKRYRGVDNSKHVPARRWFPFPEIFVGFLEQIR